MSGDRDSIKRQLEEAREDYEDLGGLPAFRSGEWLPKVISKSFRNYLDKANVDYFQAKYKTNDRDFIASKLTKVAARNAAALGAVTGAAVSTDEIVAVFTGGEGGVGIPANIAIAVTAMAGEAILLVRFQLQLVANIGKLYDVPLDPEDPEDVVTILCFATGGSAADAAGKAGMKIGGKLVGRAVKKALSKDLLASIKRIAAKVGIKILQRTMVKYTVPIASIAIGAAWNYGSTNAIGSLAKKHFLTRIEELRRT